jgi:acetate kinase
MKIWNQALCFSRCSHYFVPSGSEIIARDREIELFTCLWAMAAASPQSGAEFRRHFHGLHSSGGFGHGYALWRLDPGLIFTIADREKFTVEQANAFFNKQCGMKGLTGLSSDMREIEAAAANGNDRARLALDVFCYRVKKYVAAYIGVLNGAI